MKNLKLTSLFFKIALTINLILFGALLWTNNGFDERLLCIFLLSDTLMVAIFQVIYRFEMRKRNFTIFSGISKLMFVVIFLVNSFYVFIISITASNSYLSLPTVIAFTVFNSICIYFNDSLSVYISPKHLIYRDTIVYLKEANINFKSISMVISTDEDTLNIKTSLNNLNKLKAYFSSSN